MERGLELLDLEGEDAGNLSVKDVYSRYDKDLHSFERLSLER